MSDCRASGSPDKFLPYGRQTITDEDIAAVVEVLRGDWLTQGPAIVQFEDALCRVTGSRHAVACSNGTAALHLAMLAIELGPGDKIITTPITFLADANCARYAGADVLFADVDPLTGNIDPLSVANLLWADTEHQIKAIIPVHFAGQPAHLESITSLALDHGCYVIDDACHALGDLHCRRQSVSGGQRSLLGYVGLFIPPGQACRHGRGWGDYYQ